MADVTGSCLCGSVAFRITGPMEKPLNCHCTNCRKQHGAAFRSRIRVHEDHFEWLKGEELIKFYESSPGFRRGFCSNCGTPVVNRPGGPGYKRFALNPHAASELGIPMGILDGEPDIQPKMHVFVENKAPWFEITDDLTQYETLPKSFDPEDFA